MDAVLVYTLIDSGLWEGHHEGRRCWRDTYSESYITEYTSMLRIKLVRLFEGGWRGLSPWHKALYRGTSLIRNSTPP